MTDLTVKQAKQLDNLDKSIEKKRLEWITAYNAKKPLTGTAVLMAEGSTLETLWDELVALRTKRNTLLAKHRQAGINI